MAKLKLMQMCLIHPSIPFGREATIHFSPTRQRLLKSTICKDCVFCTDSIAYGCIELDTEEGENFKFTKQDERPSNDELVKMYNSTSQCGHFAHRSCRSRNNSNSCPRCKMIGKRLIFSNDLSKYPVYCKDIEAVPNVKGIQASSKVLSVLNWIENIPEGEKAILYSFLKSSL